MTETLQHKAHPSPGFLLIFGSANSQNIPVITNISFSPVPLKVNKKKFPCPKQKSLNWEEIEY